MDASVQGRQGLEGSYTASTTAYSNSCLMYCTARLEQRVMEPVAGMSSLIKSVRGSVTLAYCGIYSYSTRKVRMPWTFAGLVIVPAEENAGGRGHTEAALPLV